MPDFVNASIDTAMVLAAGLGQRMRPITTTLPKPLIRIAGRSMLDHALNRITDAGISKAVVNVHYLADQIEGHLASRKTPTIHISNEREELFETGGGVKKALPLLGHKPFLLFNSDSLWIEGAQSNIRSLLTMWNAKSMDILLMLAASSSLGYDGKGDFFMEANHTLRRRGNQAAAPYVYAGIAILKPELFHDTPEGAFSLNLLFNRALEQQRLKGMVLEGEWLHVGTPEAIPLAEARFRNTSS
jgi:N-acetyl-alpha-D-muramate 1-phosphate uridylyltransferase